jgi:hypothetical protein
VSVDALYHVHAPTVLFHAKPPPLLAVTRILFSRGTSFLSAQKFPSERVF